MLVVRCNIDEGCGHGTCSSMKELYDARLKVMPRRQAHTTTGRIEATAAVTCISSRPEEGAGNATNRGGSMPPMKILRARAMPSTQSKS